MTIEIKHMDTFRLIKGLLNEVNNALTAERLHELGKVLDQMEKVPETDDLGYFTEGSDPRQKMLKKWNKCYNWYTHTDFKQLSEPVQSAIKSFEAQIGEAMGPVCYAGWKVIDTAKAKQEPDEVITDLEQYVDACIKIYEDNWRF